MKKITFSILITVVYFLQLSVFMPSCNAQVPNWEWVKSYGIVAMDGAYSISSDANGNTYVTGLFFSPTLVFDAITLTNTDSTGNTSDFYIAKFNADGDVLWAKSASGSTFDEGVSVGVDGNGNAYVTGNYSSPTITFGSNTLASTTTSEGVFDVFLVKYDTAGNVIWAKTAGGDMYDVAKSIYVDVNGNSYLTGDFKSSVMTFGDTTLANNYTSSRDIFFAKYDVNGNMIWATCAGGDGDDVSCNIYVDVNGNVYATGSFKCDFIVFGSIVLLRSGSPPNNCDFFVVKFDNSGNTIWAKRAGNFETGRTSYVVADPGGNVYLTGGFKGSDITFGNILLTNSYTSNDIFAVKYDPTGNVLWAKSVGDIGDDLSTCSFVDVFGNFYITGEFGSSNITFGSTTLTNTGFKDIFITKYDALGNVVWAKNNGGLDLERFRSCTFDASGNAYYAGMTNSLSIDFDGISLSQSEIVIGKLGHATGIDKLTSESNALTIYPNPVQNELTIENNTATIQNFEIINFMGQTVYSSIIDKKVVIDMGQLAIGVYIVKLYSDKTALVRKFVKQ